MSTNNQTQDVEFGLGLIIAPAVAPISFILLLFTLDTVRQAFGGYSGGIIVGAIIVLLLGLPLSYAVAWTVGYRYVKWLQSTGRLKFRNVMASFIGLAFVFALLSGVQLLKDQTLANCLRDSLVILTMTGPPIMLSGLCFWLLSVRQRSRPTIK